MTTRTFALALVNKFQAGKGDNTLDDLDKIAEAFGTSKANLLRNLNNQNILIQMKTFEAQYSLIQGGYIQATYQVYNKTTREEKWVKGNIIGAEIDSIGLGSLNFSNKIEFAEGEYIKKITALRDGILKYLFSVHITVASRLTGATRWHQPITTTPTNIFVQTITLHNVACLTGYVGGILSTRLPHGLGAWSGVIANDIEVVNPQDQIKNLNLRITNLGLQLSEFDKILDKYNIHNAKELDKKIDKWQQNTGQSSTSPAINLPTDYQQIKDDLAKWTSAFQNKTPEQIDQQIKDLIKNNGGNLPADLPSDWKAKLQLFAALQPQMDALTQKYNDNKTELNNTKNDLSTKEVENHLLTLQVTNLTSESTQKDTRIADLEKRPNISVNDWVTDYSQRPTKKDFDDLKTDRDNRPDTSLVEYQKLLDAKNDSIKWTTVFPTEDPQDLDNRLKQSEKDLNEWTSTFAGELPSQVNGRINFLNQSQEKHNLNELKPADLPNDWRQQLNLLQTRPNIPITEAQWNNDYSQRPTNAEFTRVKDERDNLKNTGLDYEDLRKKSLKYKKDTINKNWRNLTRRLIIIWDDVDAVYNSYGKNLDDLINDSVSLANLDNDQLFKMMEDSVKRVIFYVASQKVAKVSEDAKNDLDFTRGKISELIARLENLIDLGISDLDEPNTLNNPFYLEAVNRRINVLKNDNANHANFWKRKLEWDRTTRILQDNVLESFIEQPPK